MHEEAPQRIYFGALAEEQQCGGVEQGDNGRAVNVVAGAEPGTVVDRRLVTQAPGGAHAHEATGADRGAQPISCASRYPHFPA